MIKTEANLLRFPIFALHTNGLGQLDGIEVAGTRRIDGNETAFRFTVTRNVADNLFRLSFGRTTRLRRRWPRRIRILSKTQFTLSAVQGRPSEFRNSGPSG